MYPMCTQWRIVDSLTFKYAATSLVFQSVPGIFLVLSPGGFPRGFPGGFPGRSLVGVPGEFLGFSSTVSGHHLLLSEFFEYALPAVHTVDLKGIFYQNCFLALGAVADHLFPAVGAEFSLDNFVLDHLKTLDTEPV